MDPRGIRAGVTALAIALSLAASGCGIIGNPLAAGPKKSPSSTASPSASPVPEPQAGQCHSNNYSEQLELTDDRLVDCAQPHRGETVGVGRFVGAAGSGGVPEFVEDASAAAAAVQNDAYLDCSRRADEYLGHSWFHMQLYLQLTLPSDKAWEAGDRWYRCDLYERDWQTGNDKERTGSLKTNWFEAMCVNQNKDDWPVVACGQKHPGEFVGGFLLPTTVKKEPKTDKEFDPFYDKCWRLMAPYLGVSYAKVKELVGVSAWWQYADSYWPSGRRVVFCFTWTGSKASSYVTGSAKGRKGKGL